MDTPQPSPIPLPPAPPMPRWVCTITPVLSPDGDVSAHFTILAHVPGVTLDEVARAFQNGAGYFGHPARRTQGVPVVQPEDAPTPAGA